MLDCLFVGIGGFVGTVLRYLVGKIPVNLVIAKKASESGTAVLSFPVKTLLINVVGAFVIGLITALALKHPNLSPRWILLLKVGVCGGFTTFSTFAYETSDLMHQGVTGYALLYVLLSVVLGVLAVFAAEALVTG